MSKIVIVLASLALLFCGIARAAVTTVTFVEADSPPVTMVCGETWTENGVVMHIEPTTADDCAPGPCAWFRGHGFTGNVALAPGRMVIDAASIAGPIVSVQVDVTETVSAGGACLRFYAGTQLVATARNLAVGYETIELAANGANVTHIVVSSCEGVFFEIRVEHEVTVTTEETAWGAVKAIFD